MSTSVTVSPPPGWYPDPSGQRQWRVWNGNAWSEVTRPYGDSVQKPTVVESLPLIHALHLLIRFGIVAVFSGLGLVVSSLAHWPGTHSPTPLCFAEITIYVGVGLLVAGSVLFTLALRELQGHWTALAFVPGVNIFAVGALVATRLQGTYAARRIIIDVAMVVLFVIEAHREPWLGVALVLVALGQLQWTSALLDEIYPPNETIRPAP